MWLVWARAVLAFRALTAHQLVCRVGRRWRSTGLLPLRRRPLRVPVLVAVSALRLRSVESAVVLLVARVVLRGLAGSAVAARPVVGPMLHGQGRRARALGTSRRVRALLRRGLAIGKVLV